jgi:hypothetical protein
MLMALRDTRLTLAVARPSSDTLEELLRQPYIEKWSDR